VRRDAEGGVTRAPWPIAVIGAGCASPAGFERGALGAALASGASLLGASRALAATHPGVIGAEVPAIPAAIDVGDRKLHRLMSRAARLSAIATRVALDHAALPADRRERAGFFCGVGTSNSAPDEIAAVVRAAIGEDRAWTERRMCERGLKVFHPLRTFALMPNMTLCHAAIAFGVRGPSAALFSRGAGTAIGLVEAAWAIADGDCDAAIAVGADTALDCLTWAELVREGHAARGFVPGEGAGALVLAADGDALAWIASAAVGARAIASQDMRLASSTAEWRCGAIEDVARVLDEVGDGDEHVVVAHGAVADVVRSARPRAHDLHAIAGDALAAAPALAWCAAIDRIRAGARSVVAISAGIDGHVAAVRFVRDRPSPGFDQVEPGRSIASAGWAGREPRVRAARARRPVITGVGVVSAFGVGFARLLDGLAAGERAIRPLTCFDASALAARVAGQVPRDRLDDEWLHSHLPRELAARADRWSALGALRDRKVGFALVAAAEAWSRAGATGALPLVLATGLERALIEDLAPALRGDRIDWGFEAGLAAPIVRARASVDLAARAVADVLGLGAIAVHASACAAGTLAVAHGAALVERGADAVVCGAADSMLDPIGVGGMITLGATSPRSELDACRPFDRRRDGLVLGEGAAMFVIEDEAHAIARGARPLARVLGWGASQDAHKPSAPDPDGTYAAAAMRRALDRAGIATGELDYINAHGTGTPLNDVAEVRAIRRVLGDAVARVPISSIKGAVGHLMAASGAIELAACLLAFERDLLPATANHRDRDPECDLDVIGEVPRAARANTVLSNSFGFGGQNASIVLGRPA
jgi:3-oxoacyl-(acyl-carrier-protein) synthase